MDLTAGFYRAAYRIGFHPWEEAAEHQPILASTREMIEREEAGREPPYGDALELGCGSGFWSVELARRAWRVTGIDIVEGALDRAEARVAAAGADVRLIHGDVTELASAGVGSGFRLLFDFGTLHGLSPQQRRKAGREIDAIAAADAAMLLLAWAPRPRGPLPRGMDREEIEGAFPGWEVAEVVDADSDPPKLMAALGADARWYRLKRR